jgi:hypothetical protein
MSLLEATASISEIEDSPFLTDDLPWAVISRWWAGG